MTSFPEKSRSRLGLTLLELVIVLTIIVAIAGVAVAMFPRLLTRAHTASCAANIPELFKSIQMYEAVSLDGYPDRMDTLCVDDGALASYLPFDGGGEIEGLSASILTGEEVDALRRAGIVEVTTMVDPHPDGFHPSFWPYANGNPNPQPLSEGDTVAFLDAAEAQAQGISSNGEERYVVFGLGSPTTMFGRTMNEAPVHFSDAMKGNPNDHYMRFVAVYQVGGGQLNQEWVDWFNTVPHVGTPPAKYSSGGPLRRARLRAVLAMHPGSLEGIGAHIEEYWEEVESDQIGD